MGVCTSRDEAPDDLQRQFDECTHLWHEVTAKLTDDVSFADECRQVYREECEKRKKSPLTKADWQEIMGGFVDRIACEDQRTKTRIYTAVEEKCPGPATTPLSEAAFQELSRISLTLAERDLRERIAKLKEKTKGASAAPVPVTSAVNWWESSLQQFTSPAGATGAADSKAGGGFAETAPSWLWPFPTTAEAPDLHPPGELADPPGSATEEEKVPAPKASPVEAVLSGGGRTPPRTASVPQSAPPGAFRSLPPDSPLTQGIQELERKQVEQERRLQQLLQSDFMSSGLRSAPPSGARQPLDVLSQGLSQRSPIASEVDRRSHPSMASTQYRQAGEQSDTVSELPPRQTQRDSVFSTASDLSVDQFSCVMMPNGEVQRAGAPGGPGLADTWGGEEAKKEVRQQLLAGQLQAYVFNHLHQLELKRLSLCMVTHRLSILRQNGQTEDSFEISSLAGIKKGIDSSVLPEPPPPDRALSFVFRLREGEERYLCVVFASAASCALAVTAFQELTRVQVE